ncbi:helix-turn-helix domain-containing protein [Bdellovibrio sp. HCB288]|uniref:helix-turn-helix domain-containing protein n=1 Tax=Bdellovibrio sp. HCB288 TaxID=3394355 RepID=UPI0039B636AA
MDANLKLVKPEEINPENVYAYIMQAASETSKKCEEAKAFFDFMQNQHKAIASLMEEAESLRVKKAETGLDEDEVDELNNILDTAVEIMESINRVRSRKTIAEDSMSIDDIDQQLELKDSSVEEKNFSSKFLTAYLKHKNRLGLKTQEDVAELTGLDRRYISNIERAKYRPQFKTIKRIADAFGADVSEFM